MPIRPYRGTDEPDLLAVWNAALPTDPITPADLHRRILLDPNVRPDHLLVAEVDGRAVGFALGLTREVPFLLRPPEPETAWITAFGVTPDQRGHGLGGELLSDLLGRFAAEGRTRVQISPYLPNYVTPGIDEGAYPDTVAWLQRRFGFEPIERAIAMERTLADLAVDAELAMLERGLVERGVEIALVTAGDLPDLLPFLAERFGWDWYRHAREVLLERFGPDPRELCFLVARRAGRVVGFCQQRGERFGPFGVEPEQRGLGIGRALLLRCLAEMRGRGVQRSYFLWTDERAARLYERVGFGRFRNFVVLEARL
jgi:ribosomal protein S18 acetylase RimI-like enzyme